MTSQNPAGPLRDIVIMASILEKEAHNYTDRSVIAGVLWRRIKIGMALQVDAAFLYQPRLHYVRSDKSGFGQQGRSVQHLCA